MNTMFKHKINEFMSAQLSHRRRHGSPVYNDPDPSRCVYNLYTFELNSL